MEAMMDINTLNPQQTTATGRAGVTSFKETEANKLANQTNIASPREDEKANSVAQDTATLSTEGYKLSSTSVVQGLSNETQIPDRQKAQEMVSNIVTAVQGNPAQAQKAVSNASPTRVANALA
jgi:hypothetical protein